MHVLVVDVGGTHVKLLATGHKTPRAFVSGPTLTAKSMVSGVLGAVQGWKYEVVSLGYPGPVLRGRPVSEPHNLAPGWVGFDFAAGFGCPVKIINDAAMQALGSYKGGKTAPNRERPLPTWYPPASGFWVGKARSQGWERGDRGGAGASRTRQQVPPTNTGYRRDRSDKDHC